MMTRQYTKEQKEMARCGALAATLLFEEHGFFNDVTDEYRICGITLLDCAALRKPQSSWPPDVYLRLGEGANLDDDALAGERLAQYIALRDEPLVLACVARRDGAGYS